MRCQLAGLDGLPSHYGGLPLPSLLFLVGVHNRGPSLPEAFRLIGLTTVAIES